MLGENPIKASVRRRLRRVTSGGADHEPRAPCDEQISWATAERTAPDLACVIPVGYGVIAWIDGKEKVGGSIPPRGSTQWPLTCELTPLACFTAWLLPRSPKRRRPARQQSPVL